MITTQKSWQPTAQPKVTVVPKQRVATQVPREEARPACWIPGAGLLPEAFFLPTLA